MTDRGRRWGRWMRGLPGAWVTLLGLALVWPVPRGHMPLSADHTVHLTRTWLWAQELAHGNVRGWSPVWFFGTPVGELYPVLGDLLVIAVRVASFGFADWPAAYALGFCVAFVAQGWVLLRAGRLFGWGVLPGLVAATLALADVGAYREGGFVYTVYYGVWPQALATSLAWLGLVQLAQLAQLQDATAVRQRVAWAAAAMGAALLAHPISMAVLALAGPLIVLITGVGSTRSLGRATARGLLAGALGLASAAWWVVPMVLNRAWMASYGWLWQPLEVLVPRALEGQWTQSMPASVGHCVTGGFVLVALVGNRPARAFAATAAALWLVSSSDTVWTFRLDLVSEGFTHLQYQRFLLAAKPGLFLMAGALVGGVMHAGRRLWGLSGAGPSSAAWVAWLAAATGLVGIATGIRDAWARDPPPPIQRHRLSSDPGLDADYRQLQSWLRERWRSRDANYRAVVYDQRNLHWFMDLPTLTDGAPLLKLGFTPGDNFVHKPERGPTDLLDRAQVRYEIHRSRRARRNVVATFGALQVVERPGWRQTRVANLHGEGRVDVLHDDPEAGQVRVRVRGTEGPTRLVFGIAGFPRWLLVGPDGPVEWVEVPATGFGPGATPQNRRDGEFRGGKAHGNDGSEPTLLAADVEDGEYVLRYRAWSPADAAAALLSGLALAWILRLIWGTPAHAGARAADRLLRSARKLGHPVIWMAGTLAVAGGLSARVRRGRAAESHLATGWALDDRGSLLRHAEPGFIKADMLIRPAIVFDRRPGQPAVAAFPAVRGGERLTGWLALDDDDAKQQKRGSVDVRVEARPTVGGPWTTLYARALKHQPGRIPLELPLEALRGREIDVRVVVTAVGTRPPQLGMNLDLEPRR